MKDLKTSFYSAGIIPVIKIESPDRADGLAQALRSGGLHVAEVTFRTKTAPSIIERFATHYSDILVGAGTVTTKEEVDCAVSAGAAFIVSPGFNPAICSYCIEKGIPVFPGVNNPSLIEQAMAMGLSTLKFFPAEVSGGVKALKAFESVYSSIQFIPTGGIQENNINEYLVLKNVLACGGSWIVPTDLIEAGKFEAIVGLIRSARRTILGFLPLQNGDGGLDQQKPASGTARREGAVIELKTVSLKRSLAILHAEGILAVSGSEIMKGQSMVEVELDIPDFHGRIRLIE